MIIVGCTSKPEAGDAKEFKNFFQKFLYVPAPDYASRLMLWHHFIRERLEQVSLLYKKKKKRVVLRYWHHR